MLLKYAWTLAELDNSRGVVRLCSEPYLIAGLKMAARNIIIALGGCKCMSGKSLPVRFESALSKHIKKEGDNGTKRY